MAPVLAELVDELQYRNHLLDGTRLDAARWKLANVDSVIDSLASFEKHPDRIAPTLADYLTRTALVSRDDDSPDRGGDPRGRVQLMTIHAAKGLEFDTVFIAGADDGSIPHARSLADSEANIEEERRLFYVAATRARRRLFITCPAVRRRRGPGGRPEEHAAEPSRFLDEIPSHLIGGAPDEPELAPEQASRAVRRPQAPPRLPLTGRGRTGPSHLTRPSGFFRFRAMETGPRLARSLARPTANPTEQQRGNQMPEQDNPDQERVLLRRRQRRRQGRDEGVARRQGRQPGRDDQPGGFRCRPDSPSPPRCARRSTRTSATTPPSLRGGGRRASGAAADDDGQEARRRRRSPAGERALRRRPVDAGDDGYRAQPRPQRRRGARAWPSSRATRASPGTPTGASSRCTATW